MKIVFEFENYKNFVNAWLSAQPKKGHGLRRKMAEAIHTQTGYITQVLSGSAHFSAEQGLRLANFFGLPPEEREFFLLLLQLDRAGTSDYREFISSQIKKAREDRRNLSKRFKAKTFPSDKDQSRYFSSWLYACIHVMVTCERFQSSRRTIASALGIPITRATEIIDFLVQSGFIREQGGKLVAGEARAHLGTDSPFLSRHHLNWNLLALQKILTDPTTNLHYSSVVSLSKADVDAFREIFTRALDRSNKIVADSPGEQVFAFTLNFFPVL